MVSRRLSQLTFALLSLLVTAAHAQTFYPRTDAFVFDKNGSITSWDGSDPANPPYPNAMGFVSLNTSSGGGYGSAIGIPFQLGYLNDGDLSPCNVMVWGSRTWTIGDGTHEGDTSTIPGNTTCPYFTGEYGSSGNSWNISDGFNVVATYMRHFYKSCRYGRCTTFHTDILQGGTGNAVQTEINPGAQLHTGQNRDMYALLYRCGSDRRACLIADGGGPHCPRDLPNCKP